MTRFPPLAPENMYSEQRRVAELIGRRRKPSASSQGGLEGPFVPLAYAPGILDRLQALGEHCRFHTSLPAKLRELAIIVTARHVRAPLEFHVHAMEAREFGMAEHKIQSVAEGLRPTDMDEDEAAVHDFCSEMHAAGRVSDAVYQQVEALLGKAGVIELIVTCGYYKTLGLLMNVTHPAVPAFLAGFQPAFEVPAE